MDASFGRAMGNAFVASLILALIIGGGVSIGLWELAQYLWRHIDLSIGWVP